MSTKAVRYLLVPLLAFVVVQAGCEMRSVVAEQVLRVRLENLKSEIDAMIGEAECDGSDDCRYIAFGSKPCGGPWGYLVYSIAVTDSAALAEKVAEYNRAEDELNILLGLGSDCGIPSPPTVGCVQGRCVDLGSR